MAELRTLGSSGHVMILHSSHVELSFAVSEAGAQLQGVFLWALGKPTWGVFGALGVPMVVGPYLLSRGQDYAPLVWACKKSHRIHFKNGA